jgi:hypothetical protein
MLNSIIQTRSLAAWLHEKLTVFDMDDAEDMLKKVHTFNFKAFCTNTDSLIAQKRCRCGLQ